MADETGEILNDFAYPLSMIAAPIVFFPEQDDKGQKPGYLITAVGSLSPDGIKASYNLGKPGGEATTSQKKAYLESHLNALLVLAAADDPVIAETKIDTTETRISLAAFVESTISMSKLRRFKLITNTIPGTQTEIDNLRQQIITLSGFQARLFTFASPGNSHPARK